MSLEVADVEIRTELIRFWLITFKKARLMRSFTPQCCRMGQLLSQKTKRGFNANRESSGISRFGIWMGNNDFHFDL